MTALSLITRALRAIGALTQGETPTAAEAQDGLLVLQEMVEGWATSRRTMQAVERVTFDLTSGEASYTLGEWVTTATSPQPTVSVRGTPGTTSYSYRVSSSAHATPTCRRIPGRKPTKPSSSACCNRATRSWA